MMTPACPSYAGYRFPAEIINHVVRLYFRFPLSLWMVDELLAARGIIVSYETVAETEPTQRDRHLQLIAEHGRAAWQKASGYTARTRVEATIGRFKQVIGDGLRSRTDQRRATEVDVAVHALEPHAGPGTPELRPHRLTPQAERGSPRPHP